jgi:hypothetical protein
MLVHGITSERSPLRRFTLYIFARFVEVPLLRVCFHLLGGRFRRIGGIGWFRSAIGILLARPFGCLVDTARPMPFDDVPAMIDGLTGPIAVGPCRYRTGHRPCPHPLLTDIVMRTGYEAWMKAFPDQYRDITKEEATAVVRQCHGLRHVPHGLHLLPP